MTFLHFLWLEEQRTFFSKASNLKPDVASPVNRTGEFYGMLSPCLKPKGISRSDWLISRTNNGSKLCLTGTI